MWQSLLIRKAFPLTVSYLLLIAAAIALDALLHRFNLELAGRYLGVAGTLFFLLSFIYSARKKKIIPKGPVKRFLQLHCNAGWIATASGHVGQHLVRKFRSEAKLKKQQLGIEAPPDDALDRELFWDSVTVQALDKWRTVHMPLVAFLAIVTLAHVASILVFSNPASWM
jgi:hypothetical protein